MRLPTCSDYDALVDIEHSPDHVATRAYGLVKHTFEVIDGQLARCPALPLAHDIRYGPDGERPESLPLGSDFWLFKRLTDVVVQGAAHASAPTTEMTVHCAVGQWHKRIAVLGQRRIEWRGDKARVGVAEPFTSMPIDAAHAYGGIDTRVPYPPIRSVVEAALLGLNHPGTYPRNDRGKGYYVMPERFDGIELPNLENPDDRLTDERLVLGAKEHWGRQPIPWTFDWQPHWTFPRCVFFGKPARYGPPAAELTEVRSGTLSPDYERFLGDAPEIDTRTREMFRARFYQEASTGLQLGPLPAGTRVQVSGMRPDGHELTFDLPTPPRMEIVIDGTAETVQPQMSNLVITPDPGRVAITYFARTQGLPRKLVAAVHRHVALSLRLDGDHAVTYEAPPPRRPSPS